MDLFPTILDALDLPAPSNLQGQSLLPLIRDGSRTPSGDLAISEFLFVPREQKAVRRDGFKVVYIPVSNETKAFDLANDPWELVDVAQQRTADVGTMRAVLEHEVLRRAEGFEIVARGGREEHELRVRLESARAFGEVGLVGAEDGQPATVSNDGRTVEATFRLPAATKASETGDRHVLRFHVEADQQFSVEASVDGQALDPPDFLLGPLTMRAEGAPPWRFGADDDRLAVPFSPELSPSVTGSVRIALYRVRRPPPAAATLDEKTRENLRQLGYMQ
jgi:hypothetical protein